MRRRDAVDLARLAQDALRALSPAPSPGVANIAGTWDRWANAEAGRAAAGTALLHLVRALRSEAARNRPHRPDLGSVGRVQDDETVGRDRPAPLVGLTLEDGLELLSFLADALGVTGTEPGEPTP